MGKIKEWFEKLKQKEYTSTKSQGYDEDDNLLLDVMKARVHGDCYTSTYSKDGLEFTVSFFQLYEGCDWYEFITTAHYDIKYFGVVDPMTTCDMIKSLKIENLDEYNYLDESQFSLDMNDNEYVCTVEHMLHDTRNNKIFFKIYKIEK